MRVCVVPEYPMSLMTGGLQVQAQETCRALQALGGNVSAELFNWSESHHPADLYHFMGFPPYLATVANLVRAANRPYVLTLLFGSNLSTVALWKGATRQFLKSQVLRQKERYNAIMGASAFVTITAADVRAAQIVYGVDKSRITVVPNGVADEFFQATPAAWRAQYGDLPFVLCVGAIQLRKNQLLLTKACNQLKLPLTLLGPVLPGEKAYAQQVGEAMRQNEQFGGRWIQTLGHRDPLLHSAYAACRVFALVSSNETQPLSIMEAMAAKKPVVLLKAPYTTDPLFSSLPAAAAPTASVVVGILQKAWNQAIPTALSPDYSWGSVARQLEKIYTRIVPGR